MSSVQQEVDARSNLAGTNKFEMLLFRLGEGANGEKAEIYGINVFKVREIVAMPNVTNMAGATPHMLGVVNLRGQIIPVINLPSVVGCVPKLGLRLILVTEYARSTQAFAVESVDDIVRLDWSQVLSAEGHSNSGMVTSIARLDGDVNNTRLVQVLDVESILQQVMPETATEIDSKVLTTKVELRPGTKVLAADDSAMARLMIERGLEAMNVPYLMMRTGQEAWDRLQMIAEAAAAEGKRARDKVALVLTDLEMPEMDGFTLTRNIKQDPRFHGIPVVIHSSLSGTTNEDLVRRVQADAYVAKFEAEELAGTLRKVLAAVAN